MTYENLLLEVRDGVAVVTLNRPAKRNALNFQTIVDIFDCFQQLSGKEEVRVVILTGSGEKAFAAGADINELARMEATEGRARSEKGNQVLSLIENLGKPTIAAVNGAALGGGCELAMACTLRIAAQHARFAQPEVKLGIIPGYGGTQRLPRLVGPTKAMEMLLTGDPVDAPEALRIGLVNRVVRAGELLSAVESMAKKIMANGPLAVRWTMEAVQRGQGMPLAEGLSLEAELFGKCCATKDRREGTQACLEKRPPQFMGK